MAQSPLKRVMRAQGRTQRWLADQLGIHETVLSKYANGHRPMSDELVREIARILGVPEDMLRSHAREFPCGNIDEPVDAETVHAA